MKTTTDSDALVESCESRGNVNSRALSRLLFAHTDSVVTQAMRYVVVGTAATLVDVSFLCLLKERFHMLIYLATALSFVAGLAANYVLSIRWVFSSRTLDNRLVEFLVFTVIGAVGLGLTEMIMYLGVETVKMDYKPVKLTAVLLVFAWNFGLRRILLFRGKESNV